MRSSHTVSLLRRVTRYARGGNVDPRENRLTEILAAVVDEVDGLAAMLVGEWVGAEVEGSPAQVTTQLPTPRGFFVDLELRFGSFADPDWVIWVENKHGTDLGPGQAEKYVDELHARAPGRDRVVVIAPRAAMPEVPQGVPAISWEEVAHSLDRFRRAPGRSDVERWLLDEFMDYLEEEGLAPEEPLDAAAAFALAARAASERRILRVIEFADGYLADNWAPRTDGRKRALSILPFWAHYPIDPGSESPPSAWEATWFEFTLKDDGMKEDESRDAFVFAAGATLETAANRRLSSPEYASWLAERRAAGFELRRDQYYWRLFRFLYPEELLAQSTLEEQGLALGRWVTTTFSDLRDYPPQPSSA